MANKASKASDSRVERYYNNVMELKSTRTKMMVGRAVCIAIVFVVWIAQMILSYRDETLTTEPIFWVIIVGLTVLSLIGMLIFHKRYNKVHEDYIEAIDRYNKLVGNTKSAQ